MSNDVLIVFTAKTVEQMLATGGTGDWALSSSSMRDVRYVVCTRNSDRKLDEGWGEGTEPHGSAFLVGTVSGIRKLHGDNGRDRYLVQFGEYALVSVLDFKGHARNPVTYSDIEAIRRKGLDIEKLDFMPLPNMIASAEAKKPARSKGLSIPQAKAGLSIFFSVPEDHIQITISG